MFINTSCEQIWSVETAHLWVCTYIVHHCLGKKPLVYLIHKTVLIWDTRFCYKSHNGSWGSSRHWCTCLQIIQATELKWLPPQKHIRSKYLAKHFKMWQSSWKLKRSNESLPCTADKPGGRLPLQVNTETVIAIADTTHWCYCVPR